MRRRTTKKKKNLSLIKVNITGCSLALLWLTSWYTVDHIFSPFPCQIPCHICKQPNLYKMLILILCLLIFLFFFIITNSKSKYNIYYLDNNTQLTRAYKTSYFIEVPYSSLVFGSTCFGKYEERNRS